MKSAPLFLFFLWVFAMSPGIANADDGENVKTMLLLQYESGYVILKENGARLPAQLNYDMVEERMLYIDGEDAVNELNAGAVTAVVIGSRSFIPAKDKAFYERIAAGNNEYYICHKTKVMSKGRASGYGSYSQTSSVSGLAVSGDAGNHDFSSAGSLHSRHLDEKFEGVDESAVFLKNGKKFEKINTLKKLVNLFKPHQAEIEAYSKENKINFDKMDSVKTIIEYTFSL